MSNLKLPSSYPHAMEMPCLQLVRIPMHGLPWYRRLARFIFARRHYRLTRDFTINLDYMSSAPVLRVPKGFVCDFASIPSLLSWWCLPSGIFAVPGIVHDYLYSTGSIELEYTPRAAYSGTRFPHPISKSTADKIFYELSLQVNGCYLPSLLVLAAVSLFGWWPWYKCRKKIP